MFRCLEIAEEKHERRVASSDETVDFYWLLTEGVPPPAIHAMAVFIYLFTYLLTYLLTPCSTVLLEKLTGSQLVKKFPAFYGHRRFITAFTSTRQLSLS
jgi:hypothetical protein